MDMSTPLSLDVAPETDTNPTRFYRGRVRGRSFRLQTPVIGSRSALAMSVHPTYFDLATPLHASFYRQRRFISECGATCKTLD